MDAIKNKDYILIYQYINKLIKNTTLKLYCDYQKY